YSTMYLLSYRFAISSPLFFCFFFTLYGVHRDLLSFPTRRSSDLAVAYFKGLGVFFGEKHWYWTLGLKLGFIFGTLWIISFSAAWCIVYLGLKSKLPIPPN